MAYALRLQQGNYRIDLAGEDSYTPIRQDRNGYTPTPPAANAQTLVAASNALLDTLTVTESTSVAIFANQTAAIGQQVRSIELMFRAAEQYREYGIGDPVYVIFQPAGGTEMRSEIFTGRVTLANSALFFLVDSMQSDGPMVMAQIAWVRRFYWEAVTAIPLPLTNAGVTQEATAAVHNEDQGGNHNFVDIDAYAVQGVLPTPAILTLNTSNEIDLDVLRIANHAFGDPDSFTAVLEGDESEVATLTVLPGAPNLTLYNGGYYGEHEITTTRSRLFGWTLSGAQLACLSGNHVRILARISGTPDLAVRLQARVERAAVSGIPPLWESQEIAVSGEDLEDLGSVRLSPGLWNQSAYQSVFLSIWGWHTEGTIDLDLDCVYLLVSDSYRELRATNETWLTTMAIVDDPTLGQVTEQDSSGAAALGPVAIGRAIMLWPERQQRLRFLWTETGGEHVLGRQMTVSVSYRPRFLTL